MVTLLYSAMALGSLSRALCLFMKGNKKKTLYILHCKALLRRLAAVAEVNAHLELWHKRLGHMSQKSLDVLTSVQRIDAKKSKLDFCNNFLFGKQVRVSYYSSVHVTQVFFS